MRLELHGFAPDVEPATPGVLTDCDALVPTLKGLAAANSPVDAGLAALGAEPTSAYVAELLDGSKRVFAATADAIYEAGTTTWTDRSDTGGYTGSNRMRFCTFGNVVLAANRSEAIQSAAAGSSFSAIAGAPKALILAPASGFVMALNIDGMTLGDVSDGWGCSAIRNQADWTPAAATQCVAGRLLDSPGPILAGAALGADVVAYKATSMYLGRYVGPPLVWQWTRVPGEIGCVGAEALVSVGTLHYFIGADDLYVFDGASPRSIGAPVREWFFEHVSAPNRHLIIGMVDRARALIYWFYPSVNSDGSLDACLIYNYKTDRWGKWAVGIQTALQYSSGQITYDTLGGLYSTYDALPEISFDSPFWLADTSVPAIFTGNTLQSLTGAPGISWLTTGDFGDMTDFGFLSRATPRYTRKPTAANATNFYRNEVGDEPAEDTTIELSRGRFDFRRSARWHRLRIAQTGPAMINAIDLALAPDTLE